MRRLAYPGRIGGWTLWLGFVAIGCGGVDASSGPFALGSTVETLEDTPVALYLAGRAREGEALRWKIWTGPTHGGLRGTPPELTYTPERDFHGQDAFEAIAEDASGTRRITVTIRVLPVNDAPVARAGVDQTGDSATVLWLDGSKSEDVDGDSLTYAWKQTSGPPVTMVGPRARRGWIVLPAKEATLRFTLTVGDGAAISAPDEILIYVRDRSRPGSATGLTAIAGQGEVSLGWRLPDDPDLARVHLLRGTSAYSRGPGEGLEVYTGLATAFVDRGLQDGVRYRYALFTEDAAGNFGPPALASATPNPVVAPRYPEHGEAWNTFVAADGPDALHASGAACVFATAERFDDCLHAGELREVVFTGPSSCAGVSAVDDLGAFEWRCIESGGRAVVVSSGLKPETRVADLLRFDQPGWLPNAVNISVDGRPAVRTLKSIWWSNPVIALDDPSRLAASGQVLLLPAGTRWTQLQVAGSGNTIVAEPGSPVVFDGWYGLEAWSVDALWIEGAFRTDTWAIRLDSVRFATFRQIDFESSGGAPIIDLLASHGARIEAVNMRASGGALQFQGGGGNLIRASIFEGGDGYRALIEVAESGDRFEDLDIVANGRGLFLWGDEHLIERVEASSQASSRRAAIEVNGARNTLLSCVTTGGGYGLKLRGAYVHVEDFEASRAVHAGLRLDYRQGYGSRLSRLHLWNNGIGIEIKGNGARFEDLLIEGNSGSGIRFQNAGGVVVERAVIVGNGVGVSAWIGLFYVSLHDLLIAGNGAGISLLWSMANRFSNLSVVGNTMSGIMSQQGWSNVWANILVANNGGMGFALWYGQKAHLMNIASVANEAGLSLSSDPGTAGGSALNLAAMNSTGVGISIPYGNVWFSGRLRLGANAGGDCVVDPVAGGLESGSCLGTGGTAPVLTRGLDASGSFVGPILVDDAINQSDLDGAAVYEAIADWSHFENPYRAWGREGGPFPAQSPRGACLPGETCRIRDWRLAGSDSALLDVNPWPSGDDVFLTRRGTMALRTAVEIAGDEIGNDDLLCESGEACLVTPNIGSYQGHGAIVPAGSIGLGGAVESVTLFRYEANGVP